MPCVVILNVVKDLCYKAEITQDLWSDNPSDGEILGPSRTGVTLGMT